MVEITYDGIVGETDRAFRFIIGDDLVWIAKSHIQEHDEKNGTIEVPEWVALEQGLI